MVSRCEIGMPTQCKSHKGLWLGNRLRKRWIVCSTSLYWVLLFSLLCSARTTSASSTPTSRGRPRWTPRAAPRCPRASTWCSRGSPTWPPPSSRRCRRTSSDQEVFAGPVSDHFTGKLNNIFELKCPYLHPDNTTSSSCPPQDWSLPRQRDDGGRGPGVGGGGRGGRRVHHHLPRDRVHGGRGGWVVADRAPGVASLHSPILISEQMEIQHQQ